MCNKTNYSNDRIIEVYKIYTCVFSANLLKTRFYIQFLLRPQLSTRIPF